jgi:hypothetical protein
MICPRITKGRAMTPELSSAQSSAPLHAGLGACEHSGSFDEDDLALGCECANPALQIDAWNADSAATAAN